MRGIGLALALLAGCATKPGAPCEDDKDCGRGFDCYQKACTRVCTSTDECDPGDQCVRYRCMKPGAPERHPLTGAPAARPNASEVPPMPDSTAAELRALRHEIEEIRRTQTRILELLEKQEPKKGEAKKPTAEPTR